MGETWRQVVLMSLALCAFVLSGTREARAAPIGMCADTAQSVEAPPPLFPADEAELSPSNESHLVGCQSGDEERFGVQAPGNPGERVAPSAEIPDQKVILGVVVPVLRANAVRFNLGKLAQYLPEEHRWRGLRPPRS